MAPAASPDDAERRDDKPGPDGDPASADGNDSVDSSVDASLDVDGVPTLDGGRIPRPTPNIIDRISDGTLIRDVARLAQDMRDGAVDFVSTHRRTTLAAGVVTLTGLLATASFFGARSGSNGSSGATSPDPGSGALVSTPPAPGLGAPAGTSLPPVSSATAGTMIAPSFTIDLSNHDLDNDITRGVESDLKLTVTAAHNPETGELIYFSGTAGEPLRLGVNVFQPNQPLGEFESGTVTLDAGESYRFNIDDFDPSRNKTASTMKFQLSIDTADGRFSGVRPVSYDTDRENAISFRQDGTFNLSRALADGTAADLVSDPMTIGPEAQVSFRIDLRNGQQARYTGVEVVVDPSEDFQELRITLEKVADGSSDTITLPKTGPSRELIEFKDGRAFIPMEMFAGRVWENDEPLVTVEFKADPASSTVNQGAFQWAPNSDSEWARNAGLAPVLPVSAAPSQWKAPR